MKKIIFVYNANSGPIQGGFDFFHKIISPKTYACNLCNITHGIFMERNKWKAFRKNVKIEMEFLYKDEFEKEFNQQLDYPVILINKNKPEILIASEKINQLNDLDALIDLLNHSLDLKDQQ